MFGELEHPTYEGFDESATAEDAQDSDQFLDRVAHHCTDLFSVSAAGVMLVGPGGDLHAAATAAPAVPELGDLFAAHPEESPCADSCHLLEPVIETDLARADRRWPEFATDARKAGVRGVLAFPLHDRETSIGALGLLATKDDRLDVHHVRLVGAIADIAVVGLLQRYTAAHGLHGGVTQLQSALDVRVVIEQAKGMLAQRGGIDVAQAFQALFRFARKHRTGLVEVAESVVDGTVDSSRILDALSTAGVRQRRAPTPRAEWRGMDHS
ncbi:GAF and ANTAR domain-containing protein [Actinopolymorpha sp. B9G3]|uniref:GAF and ANTAR domain-containing protein n=1 Tax=Actinopolymorpha sp. B9G3 TaxID=3158970 RepID=UPI0032D9A98E